MILTRMQHPFNAHSLLWHCNWAQFCTMRFGRMYLLVRLRFLKHCSNDWWHLMFLYCYDLGLPSLSWCKDSITIYLLFTIFRLLILHFSFCCYSIHLFLLEFLFFNSVYHCLNLSQVSNCILMCCLHFFDPLLSRLTKQIVSIQTYSLTVFATLNLLIKSACVLIRIRYLLLFINGLKFASRMMRCSVAYVSSTFIWSTIFILSCTTFSLYLRQVVINSWCK